MQYTIWPLVNNGYQQMTQHNSTNGNQNKTIIHEQSVDPGRETMHLRALFDVTAIDQNLRPIRSSTLYSIDTTPNPSASQSSSYSHRHQSNRSISPSTSHSNEFGRRHIITTQYNTPCPPDFSRLSESSDSFADRQNFPHRSWDIFHENTRSASGSFSESKRPKWTNRPSNFYGTKFHLV